MTFSAFLLLEINLWLPANSNIISMADATLGRLGKYFAWFCYLLLLYTLISAFISGGSDIVREWLLSSFDVHAPHWATNLIFVGIFFYIVYHGIYFVDIVNRGFMFVKLVLYVLLVTMIFPHVNPEHFTIMHPVTLLPIMTVAITAYGFSIIVPSLRVYFNSDVKKLRTVILCGSLVPLVCYTLWDFVVLGTLPLEGRARLIACVTFWASCYRSRE